MSSQLLEDTKLHLSEGKQQGAELPVRVTRLIALLFRSATIITLPSADAIRSVGRDIVADVPVPSIMTDASFGWLTNDVTVTISVNATSVARELT